MTAQAPDVVRYAGRDYELAGVRGTGLFDPRDHGVEFVATTTANWRGHVPVYVVRDERLVLDALRDVGLPDVDPGEPLGEDLPRINGVAPVWGEWSLEYRDLDLPLAFTGGLLLASGFLAELYVHMGFAPAWKFEVVHELVFEDGRLVRAHDRSAQVARVREEILRGQRDDPDDAANTIEWIARTFELDYGRTFGP
jgi:hypothetical protein